VRKRTDRRQTDEYGRATQYSELEYEFTFAKTDASESATDVDCTRPMSASK